MQLFDQYVGNYDPRIECFDEAFDSNGSLRAPWSELLDQFGQIGYEELNRRWHFVQEDLLETGGDPFVKSASKRNIDLFPQIIAAEEWREIELALIQRCKLLDLVLRDLYSENTAAQSGVLPAD